VSRYALWVHAAARDEIDELPGNMRQRVRNAIAALREDPRPSVSKALTLRDDIELEVRRIRLDPWRIVYAIDEDERAIAVFAIRKRPPYDYTDIEALLSSKRR